MSVKHSLFAMVMVCVMASPFFVLAEPSTEFSSTETLRDPFWPVGYVSKKEKLAELAAAHKADSADAAREAARMRAANLSPRVVGHQWNKAMKKVAIQGVSRSGKEYLAIINGKLKNIGDTVSVSFEGTMYTWAVGEVKPPSSVKLRRLSAQVDSVK